jgi:hypothetical protein
MTAPGVSPNGATTTSGSVALISWVARSLARMTRHNRTDAAEDQAVESARSRELFMSVSLLRGPGEANHRDSVMTSHLPGGKPGSVATDIGSLDMTKRNRDLEQRGPAASPPGAVRPPGRRPATSARTGTAAHRLVLAHLACRARPPPGRLPPAGRLAEVDDSFTLIPWTSQSGLRLRSSSGIHRHRAHCQPSSRRCRPSRLHWRRRPCRSPRTLRTTGRQQRTRNPPLRRSC